MTLDEANAMLAEFETDKETAMDTLTDGDEGIQVVPLVWFSYFTTIQCFHITTIQCSR